MVALLERVVGGLDKTYVWWHNHHSFNTLYSDEKPSALRAYKKLIADPSTYALDMYLRDMPIDLKEPFDRFLEKPFERATIVVDYNVGLEDWIYDLQDASENVNIYHLRDAMGKLGNASFAVVNNCEGFMIGHLSDSRVFYYRRGGLGAGDLYEDLQYALRIQGKAVPISRSNQ